MIQAPGLPNSLYLIEKKCVDMPSWRNVLAPSVSQLIKNEKSEWDLKGATTLSIMTLSIIIVSKVSQWDKVVARSADFYSQNIINLKCTLALYLYSNGKKGKRANSKRDRERVCKCGSVAEGRNLASVIKLTVGKNPVTSFWDKQERITIFWETILMEKWDKKDT
jgi:hypothetical protein